MNIRMYTAAREATTRARNVASAIQQVTRQVNDDNKDIMDKVDKNTQVRAKRKAELELYAAQSAKKLAEKQASIAKKQAGLAIVTTITSFVASRIGKGIDKANENEDANANDDVKGNEDVQGGGDGENNETTETNQSGNTNNTNRNGNSQGNRNGQIGGNQNRSQNNANAGAGGNGGGANKVVEVLKEAFFINAVKDAFSKDKPEAKGSGEYGTNNENASINASDAENNSDTNNQTRVESRNSENVLNADTPITGQDRPESDTRSASEIITATDGEGATRTDGEGATRTDGEGATRTDGEGATRTDGEGATRTDGEGATRTDGEGATRTDGEGATRTDGEGATRTDGEGTTRTDGEGATRTDGEGTTRTDGEGATRTDGNSSVIENRGTTDQTSAERGGLFQGFFEQEEEGVVSLDNFKGFSKLSLALGLRSAKEGEQATGLSAGTPVGDTLLMIANLINKLNEMTASEKPKSRFGAIGSSINKGVFLLTEGTDEDLNGVGRALRDFVGKPLFGAAGAAGKAISAATADVQDRVDGDREGNEREIEQELRQTGSVSLNSQQQLGESLKSRALLTKGTTEAEASAQAETGVQAFAANVVGQKLDNAANPSLNAQTNVSLGESSNANNVALTLTTTSNVLDAEGNAVRDADGNIQTTESTKTIEVGKETLARAAAGDPAALAEIQNAPAVVASANTDDAQSDDGSGESLTGGDNNQGIERSSALANTSGEDNEASKLSPQETLKAVQDLGNQGLDAFKGASVNQETGEITLVDGRTVTANDSGGIEVNSPAGANATVIDKATLDKARSGDATALKNIGILDQVTQIANNNGVDGFAGARIVGDQVKLSDGRAVGGETNSSGFATQLNIQGALSNQGNFNIDQSALNALNGTTILDQREPQRLSNAVQAGLNITENSQNTVNFSFNSQARSTESANIGDRNNSVQLSIEGRNIQSSDLAVRQSGAGNQQLTNRAIEQAANGDLGRSARQALGVRRAERPRNVDTDSAFDAAFAASGIDRGALRRERSASRFGNVRTDFIDGFSNRGQGLTDPTEALKENTLATANRNLRGALDAATGDENTSALQAKRDVLTENGFSPEEAARIITQGQNGNINISNSRLNKALENRIGISRSTGENGGPVIQALVTGQGGNFLATGDKDSSTNIAGSLNVSANQREELQSRTVNGLSTAVTNRLNGIETRDGKATELKNLGFTDQEIGSILGDDNGTTTVSTSALNNALSGRVQVNEIQDANGFSSLQASVTGGNADALAALGRGDSATATDNNVIRSVDVSPEARARGLRISGGTGTGIENSGNGQNDNTVGGGTDQNVRIEVARRLSLSAAQGGLGLGRINADDLVLGADGNVSGIKVDGQEVDLETFAQQNSKKAEAIAKRRNRILGLSGDKAERALNASQIQQTVANVTNSVRSDSDAQLNDSLSGASAAAKQTFNTLSASGLDLSNAQTIINNDGSISINANGQNFNIGADGQLRQNDARGERESFGDRLLGSASRALGINTGNAQPVTQDDATVTSLANALGTENFNIGNYRAQEQQVQDLTNQLNDAFQVNFGLFKVGEQVKSINATYDANGDIASAGVLLDDGTKLDVRRDSSTGELTIAGAEGPNARSQSIRGGIDYFNAGRRSQGFQNILQNLGATNIEIDERNNDQSRLRRDDNNAYNNNFKQEGRLRFELEGQYFDVGYGVDVNGGISLNLNGLSEGQRAALEEGIKKADQRTINLLSGDRSAFTRTLNSDPQAARRQLADAIAARTPVSSDTSSARATVSSNLVGSDDVNRQAAESLSRTLLNSNLTISSGQNLAQAFNDNGISANQRQAIQQTLDNSQLVNQVRTDAEGADTRRVISEAIRQSGITDDNKVKNLTDAVLKDGAQLGYRSKEANAELQFARLFGAGNRGLDAIRDNDGYINSGNLSPTQRRNATTQYNNVVASERALINSFKSANASPALLTTGLQALRNKDQNDQNALALIDAANPASGDNPGKAAEINQLRADINAELARGTEAGDKKAQDLLNDFLRKEGLYDNAIKLDLTKDTLAFADEANLGRVNVTAGFDGSTAQITADGIGFTDVNGNRGRIDSVNITQNKNGNYTVNVNPAADNGTTAAASTVNDVIDNINERYDDGEKSTTEKVGSFLDQTTRFLGETLDTILPGIQAYKKAMEDLQDARVRLEAAKDQLAAAIRYAEEMGVTFGSTNGDAIEGGGDGGGTGGAGGVGAAGGATGAGNAGSGAAGGASGVENGGNSGGSQAGDADGVIGSSEENTTPATTSEQQEAQSELLAEVASDSNFANIAVLIGLNPGMIIEQAQQMDMLEQLSETIQQLQSPFSNPVQSMRDFVERLEMAQSQTELPQDGIVL